jgi:hypothetical protein
VGERVGLSVGERVGLNVGCSIVTMGELVGVRVGLNVGEVVGLSVGCPSCPQEFPVPRKESKPDLRKKTP